MCISIKKDILLRESTKNAAKSPDKGVVLGLHARPAGISHHQCADPRIDSLGSPHLESKCSGPLHKDSHPKPASDRVLTPSRTRISSPLFTAREQRPYRAPNRNVTHVIRGSHSWPTKRHILQNKQEQHSPTKRNPVAYPRDGSGLFAHWPQSGG
jgi:hypothetical protein